MVTPGEIRRSLQALQNAIHTTAVQKGWWDDHTNLRALVEAHGKSYDVDANLPDVLFRTAKSMLAVTEISAAWPSRFL